MILLKKMSGEELDLTTLGMGISWVRNELGGASFDNRVQKIPGSDTDWFFGVEFGTLPLSLELKTASMDLEKIDAVLDTLNRFLFDSYGRPIKLKAYFNYHVANGLVYRLVRLNQAIDVSYDTSFHTIRLVFTSVDRFKYADTLSTLSKTIASPSGTMAPVVKGLVVPPNIMLTGTGTNVILASAGKSIVLGTFATTTTFDINTERYVVKINSVESMVKIPGGFVLEPNQPFSVSGTSMNVSVTLQWRDRYI